MRHSLIHWVVALGVLLLDVRVALARAGGGGGYSSGGGGSSSSSSSSSGSHFSGGGGGGGSGELGGVELVLLVIVAIVFLTGAGRRFRGPGSARATRDARSRERAAELARRDPDFDLAAFESRVRRAFLRIQEAWSSQDLSAVRGFLSDGVHERFSIQLREQRTLGYRNVVSDVAVLRSDLLEVRTHEHFDVVSVRIDARATDFRIDLESGREIAGSRRAEAFSEVWSFLRGRDARTGGGGGLFEGQCPNCAAPVEPERAWSCLACGSARASAPPDWVLSEITQLCEWRGARTEEPDGLKEATARDPGLTRQQLEDRASVLFWRLMDSDRTGEARELASVARPAFVERQRRWLAERQDHYIGDCAVGSVDLRGLVPGREWDLALVEVRWAGGGFERRSGAPPRDTGGRSLRRSLLVMARRSDACSTVGRCVVSAHCPGCGAPDEGSLDGACAFCGEPLNDGRDWILDRFLARGENEAVALLGEARRGAVASLADEATDGGAGPAPSGEVAPPPAPRGAELLAWCLRLTYADQSVDRRERDGLAALAERLHVPAAQARSLMRAAQFGRLEVETPASPEEAQRWLETLDALAQADGRLDRREREVLAELARQAGSAAHDARAEASTLQS